MNAAKIAKELKALEAKNRACAEQLRVLYGRYLNELSHTASQQLMGVCYHLCTQSYPEAFLGLSSQEREQLQKRVRRQGERLRQQLSLESLLLPDPGDIKEPSQPRVAVIKAELTGDDLEVLTNALNEDNSDRILTLLKEKDIELPFDLEAVMEQRRQLATDDKLPNPLSDPSSAESPVNDLTDDLAAAEDRDQLPAFHGDGEPEDGRPENKKSEDSKPEGDRPHHAEPEDSLPTADHENPSLGDGNAGLDSTSEENLSEASRNPASEAEGYSSTSAGHSSRSAPASGSGRSLGRRFLEDILSGRALERRRGSEDAASMSGEGSLRVENRPVEDSPTTAAPEATVDADAADRAAAIEESNTTTAAESAVQSNKGQPNKSQDIAELETFADNNGFDPNFEPPPAEDRYEPTPLRSNDKLDISPGVLASALVAEGEDDRGGMLMRPLPYDGSTELSEEALRDPSALIRWVERMERGISQRLRQSSQRMTRSLEKSGILNNELPDGLLEAAVRPDGDHEDDSDRAMPHVLSLRLNAAGKENRPRQAGSIRIVAIYLRLSEIEFATPAVMAWRNQLRNQVKQLQQLSAQYKDCKHSQSLVEAQALWNEGWKQNS